MELSHPLHTSRTDQAVLQVWAELGSQKHTQLDNNDDHSAAKKMDSCPPKKNQTPDLFYAQFCLILIFNFISQQSDIKHYDGEERWFKKDTSGRSLVSLCQDLVSGAKLATVLWIAKLVIELRKQEPTVQG